MKHLYNMAWGFLLLAGLASCEMKEELSGGKTSEDTGVLQIGLAVNKAIENVATRAGEDDAEEGVGIPVEGDPVAADGFEIDITGENNFSEQIIYDADGTNVITLPVGTYTVYAHTPGALASTMPDPYYGLSQEITITKDVDNGVSMNCVMENTRIHLGYDQGFLDTYATWEITVESASGQAQSAIYEGTGEYPEIDEYWNLGEGVSEIIVKGRAVLKEGGASVPVSKVLKKQNGENFVGAEALNITLVLGSGSATGTASGVDVEVNLFGTEPDGGETVKVPIETEDEPVTPKPPVEGESPTISFPNEQNTATYTLPGQATADATAKISAPAGLKHINVTIQAEGTFAGIVSTMGIGNFDLLHADNINGTDLSTVIAGILQKELPGEGDTSYDFPVHKFFSLITQMMGTSDETHVFIVEVVDANDEKASATLTINVKAQTAEQEPSQGE